MRIKYSFIFLLASLVALATGCSSGGSGGGSSSSTFEISGTLDQNASSSGISSSLYSELRSLVGLKPYARTQCNDGFYYSVYCVSFSTPPVAAEGDVDCTGGGGFTVSGLPVGEAVGCFVRRYESASASSSEASTVGAIQIPAANLNGSTEQIVSSGNVGLDVSISNDGTISANVTSGTVNDDVDDSASSNFTASNMNGVWELACNSTAGGSTFAAGLCKCFLGEDSVLTAAGYNDESECFSDSNGPGAAITADVSIGIGLYVYDATTSSPLSIDNGLSIPTGSTINAISIWGASGSSGSYTSLKAGGEGATNLGGVLSWNTTGPDNPVTAVTWATSVDPDGGGSISAVTIPTVPAANASHATWVTWAQTVTSNAVSAGWTCQTTATNPDQHVWCINEALDLFGDSMAVLPRIYIMPYCDQNGCRISSDTGEFNGASGGDANTFKMARLEVEGLHYDYDGQGSWSTSSDFDSLTPDTDGIGIEPEGRYVFEPLEFFPGGAGFRQSDHDERHYQCGATQFDVQNAACSDSGNHFELVCHSRNELAIKFLGTTAPINVMFDQSESVAYAELVEHTSSGPQEVQPTGTTAVQMCIAHRGGRAGVFFATANKQ